MVVALKVVIISTLQHLPRISASKNGTRRNPKDDAGMAEALSEYGGRKSLLSWAEERCSTVYLLSGLT